MRQNRKKSDTKKIQIEDLPCMFIEYRENYLAETIRNAPDEKFNILSIL